MPFETGILIKSEADLAALKLSEEATQKLRGELQKLGTTAQQTSQQTRLIGPGMIATVPATDAASAAVTRVGAATRNLGPLLTVAVSQLGGMSAGAGTLARGLTGLVAGGFTPVGVAMSATLIGFGLYQDRMRDTAQATEEARRRLEAFADSLTQANSRAADIAASTELIGKDRLRQLEISGAAEIRRIEENLDKQLSGEKLTQDQRRAFVEAAEIQKRLQTSQTSRLIEEALNQELSTIGRMNATTAINTQIRKENAFAAAEQAGASKEVVAALKAEVEAAKARIGAIDAKERVPSEELAIRKQIAEVTKKIQEAAKGGLISPTEIAQLKGQIEGIYEAAIQKWGTEMPAAVEAGLAKVSARIDQLAALKQITPVEINAEQPFREMAAIEAKAAALRAMLSAPITMTVIANQTGSPTLPFSEYWERYAPDVIAKFAGRVAGTDLVLNSPFIGIMQENLAKIVELRALIGRASGVTGSPHVIGDFSAQARGELAERMAFISEFARAGARSAAAVGGGNINITIDASDLLNGLERTVRTTTGQTLNIRVLN